MILPIHPVFTAWLMKQTRGIGKAPVFPSLAGKNGAGKSGLSMAFKRIMDRAGIQGRILRERNGEGRSQSSLSFHSLRHSFNSELANSGVEQEIRQKLTGHASPQMNEVYTHRELELGRGYSHTSDSESEGAPMAKSEGKESFEIEYLPPLWPVLNTLREGLPSRDLEGESTQEIAARASGLIQELAARVKQHCSAQKLTDERQCTLLFFVVSDGVRVLHQLAKAFPKQFRRIAEVMPGFPCMFPAHPDELKLLKEEMLNKFNLGKRNTFKLRAAPGRKTFSFEKWVNKLLIIIFPKSAA